MKPSFPLARELDEAAERLGRTAARIRDPLTPDETIALATDRILNNASESLGSKLARAANGDTVYQCRCGESFSFLSLLRFHEVDTGHEPADECGCPPGWKHEPDCHHVTDTRPVHRPAAYDVPIPGEHHYDGCGEPGEQARVNPDGICEGCGGPACPDCGREGCPGGERCEP